MGTPSAEDIAYFLDVFTRLDEFAGMQHLIRGQTPFNENDELPSKKCLRVLAYLEDLAGTEDKPYTKVLAEQTTPPPDVRLVPEGGGFSGLGVSS